jgi:hypothetical protein
MAYNAKHDTQCDTQGDIVRRIVQCENCLIEQSVGFIQSETVPIRNGLKHGGIQT